MPTLTLELDDLDFEAVTSTIAMRERSFEFPDHQSNADGAALAEICRGWRDFMTGTTAGDYLERLLDEEKPDAEEAD